MQQEQQQDKRTLSRLCEQAVDMWQVYKWQLQPKHPAMYYNRDQLKALCSYFNREQLQRPVVSAFRPYALIPVLSFLLSTMCALPESMDDFVAAGQDILWIFGISFVAFKTVYFYLYADEIDEIIDALDACHHMKHTAGRGLNLIRANQRNFFLLEGLACAASYVLVLLFCLVVIVLPFCTGQPMPFHSVYPLHWNDPELHPIAHKFAYVWQSVSFFYSMWLLMLFELLCVHCFPQVALNLKILCIELRHLHEICGDNLQLYRSELHRLVKFHQHIISIVRQCNTVFHKPFVVQMIIDYLMITLSTFQGLAARHEPSVASRFVVFTFLAFFHLSYWSIFGDMVSQQSLKVADAAFHIKDWHKLPVELQRDIKFIIMRAQKPLGMQASPFPPFNLPSSMVVLKQCYSVLTVMAKHLD